MTIISFTTTKSLTVLRGSGAMSEVGPALDKRKVSRAFVLTGQSIATKTPLLDDLRGALGPRYVGHYDRIGAHTPMPELIEAVIAARAAGADTILALGGGSVVDAAKIAAACLAFGIDTMDGLRDKIVSQTRDPIPGLPTVVMIPTTASAAEFTTGAGVFDPEKKHKNGLNNPSLVPDLVVLDPDLIAHTPPFLWLSSAIRSVDHAVEALGGWRATPYTDALAEKALELLFDALPRCHADPADTSAIGDVQSATWLAGTACTGAGTGISHGIGYLFGANFGVPHGVCSCITLPYVMAWNAEAGGKADRVLCRVAGASGPEAVDRLIRTLGLPRALSEVSDVSLAEAQALAPKALALPHAPRNPKVLDDEAKARELLERMY
ncbi:iron-containing alcohol dehydrogenase [Pseudooceanicola sp.]|uniref:iron-containing alcohol dehydrogenase n=1 Tax=Pseudooceanicola sp. TaxID=1914328 RepID=UPI0035C6B9E4